jgi:hypothetical protein
MHYEARNEGFFVQDPSFLALVLLRKERVINWQHVRKGRIPGKTKRSKCHGSGGIGVMMGKAHPCRVLPASLLTAGFSTGKKTIRHLCTAGAEPPLASFNYRCLISRPSSRLLARRIKTAPDVRAALSLL